MKYLVLLKRFSALAVGSLGAINAAFAGPLTDSDAAGGAREGYVPVVVLHEGGGLGWIHNGLSPAFLSIVSGKPYPFAVVWPKKDPHSANPDSYITWILYPADSNGNITGPEIDINTAAYKKLWNSPADYVDRGSDHREVDDGMFGVTNAGYYWLGAEVGGVKCDDSALEHGVFLNASPPPPTPESVGPPSNPGHHHRRRHRRRWGHKHRVVFSGHVVSHSSKPKGKK